MKKYAISVPMEIHAMVVNDYVRNNQPFRRHRMDYKQMNCYSSPEPPPFQKLEEDFRNNPDSEGIYLHWTLPKGFTHAAVEEGAISFPLVPNRWLVIRKKHGEDSSPYDAAWIVISDRLDTPDGSPYRLRKNWREWINSIGDIVSLDRWEEDSYKQFLTAEGVGDISFSAFQPGCKNVFSIHDRLESPLKDAEVELDYFVYGWYSNPEADPLYHINTKKELEEILLKFKWLLNPSDEIPGATVICGALVRVKWKWGSDPAVNPRTAHPNRKVVIGLNSTDAICELMGTYDDTPDQEMTQLLEVHQYEQLHAFDEVGALEMIDDAIHKRGFDSQSGGRIWKLVKGEKDDDTTYDDKEEWELVAKLNVVQRELDNTCRAVQTRQQQVYEAWWKYKKCTMGLCDEVNQLNDLHLLLRGLLRERKRQADDVYEKVHKITEILNRQGKKRKLIFEDMPRFWSPNDPLVLITGFHRQKSGALDTSVTCSVFEYEEASRPYSGPDPFRRLPRAVAEAAAQGIPDHLRQVWDQPWMPMFLEWEVEWTPIPYTKDNWRFDGREIQLTGTYVKKRPQVHKGRTLLGPHSIYSLKDKLNKYVKDYPGSSASNLEDMIDFIEMMDDWDVLSQSLSGLCKQFFQRDPRMYPLPDESDELDLETVLEKQTDSMPKDTSLKDRYTTNFQPFGCGHMVIKRLSVLDAFGQVDEVPTDIGSIHITESLRTLNDDPGVAEFKPRIVQGARLNFRWVSASKDDLELHMAPGVNPVCGIILPNHLERGLSCYDPQGILLGDVKLKGTSGSPVEAYWEPAPDIHSQTKLSSYRHLNKFIDSLKKTGNKGNELSSFLSAIDETLWVVNPKERKFDEYLSVLIGRPLILARVKLSLELNGYPHYHPKIFPLPRPGYPPLPRYTREKFSIRLGNVYLPEDGLIGYYLNDNYDTFYSVYNPCKARCPYIKEIGPENFIKVNLENNPVYITMIFDPEASVQAHTDIVPYREVKLAPEFYRHALHKMEVFFRTGPILTAILERTGEPKQIILPTPHLTKGEWTWYERNKDNSTQWDSFMPKDEDKKDLPTRAAPTLREGLLRVRLTEAT